MEENIQEEQPIVEEKPETNGEKKEQPSDSWKYNPEYHRTAEFLGIDKYDREDYETANRVAFLVDWAKEQNNNDDYLKAVVKLDELRRDLGVTYQGRLLVNSLYQQVRVMLDRQRVEDKIVAEQKQKVVQQAEEQVKAKLRMENIKPEFDEKDIEQKVKESMRAVNRQIKQKVKSQITQTVNKGIKEALEKAKTGDYI